MGEWFTLNMIIIFILIVFGLLSATLNYYKAFKMNSSILYIIDKYEGYNSLSKVEIERHLQNIGYTASRINCPDRGELKSVNDSEYSYCIYYIADDTPRGEKNGKYDKDGKTEKNQPLYYNYSVVTYIHVNLPLINAFSIPVYTKGERIYNFTDGQYNGENYGESKV